VRLLIAEDEKRLNRLIRDMMEDEGFTVDSCYNGAEALEYVRSADYDAIIMDVMMPVMDGLEAVRKMRSEGVTTPVLFLTAKDSIDDRVTGLESGGDYYMVKPFSFRELTAAVRAIMRKYSDNKSSVFTAADLELDTASKVVKRSGRVIELTRREYALLEYMMRNKGVVLTREMIENSLYNFDYEGASNVVDVYIGYLRKKMDTGYSQKLIHTVWGVGWILKDE
jgi:two-component system copper resistance phosphate regulon response regulator CusR